MLRGGLPFRAQQCRRLITEGNGFISVSIRMSGDAFPNAETLIGDKFGHRVMLHTFETTGERNSGPFKYLPFDMQRDMGRSEVKIYHDQVGNFSGYEGNGQSSYLR